MWVFKVSCRKYLATISCQFKARGKASLHSDEIGDRGKKLLIKVDMLTRQNDVEDARLFLFPNLVFGLAHERAIIFIVPGCVSELRSGSVDGRSSCWRHMDQTRRIVEGPMEAVNVGIGNYVAKHVHHLLFAHAMNHGLGIFAHWNVCEMGEKVKNMATFLLELAI